MSTSLDVNPFAHFDQTEVRKILDWLLANPLALLQVRQIRQLVTRQRLERFKAHNELARIGGDPETSIHNAVEHNIQALYKSAEIDRPMQLIAPVWSIDRIARNVHKLRVLSIGPRSEIEIFSLLAMGFRIENITAIDLISYSPYVKVGDMHALPLPDNAFDVILLGWVLAYSKTPQLAANEVTRVAAPSCVVAVAGDYNDPSTAPDRPRSEGHALQSSDDFLKLWQGQIGQIYVRQNCDYPNTALNMAVFEIIKSVDPT